MLGQLRARLGRLLPLALLLAVLAVVGVVVGVRALTSSAPPPRLVAATANVADLTRGTGREGDLARLLADQHVAVVGLEEVCAERLPLLTAALAARGHPMQVVATQDTTRPDCSFGNALLSVAALTDVARTTYQAQLAGTDERRSLTCATTGGGLGPVRVCVTHLVQGGLPAAVAVRTAQAREAAVALAAAGGPAVLLGDLNASPAAPGLAPLLGTGSGLVEADRSGAATFDATQTTPQVKIDYVLLTPATLASAGARALREAPVGQGSDHLVLVADLRRRPRADLRP